MKTRRKAVAPVIATLLMIAVAVAMSVIIFMWAQGFLSNTSSATGGQQGAQNQAAQSSISIESATANPSTNTLTIIVRNVGAVSVTLGSYQVTGISSNIGFKASLAGQLSFPPTGTTISSSPNSLTLAKGNAVVITLVSTSLTMQSGDVLSPIKITTQVGTFADSQITVP